MRLVADAFVFLTMRNGSCVIAEPKHLVLAAPHITVA